jgi:hypothetical protein
MKTARIRAATTNGITIVKFILEAQSMNGLSIQKTQLPADLNVDLAIGTLRLLAT